MALLRRKHSLAAAWVAIHRLERNLMGEQNQVDALEASVAQVAADLATAQSTLQAELDELAGKVAAGEPVNLTKLTEAVASLDPAVHALGALKPA